MTSSARVTAWLLAWGDRRSGAVVLVVLTLLEATIFPAPTEAMLLALCVSRPRRTPWFAALASVGSLAGGLIGYHLGASTFESIGTPTIHWLGAAESLPAVEAAYRSNAWVALLTSGYTPIPYMLYTMAAGAFSIPLDTFVLGSLGGRALKFIPLALLAWYIGPAVHRVAARFASAAGIVVVVLLVTLVLWRML